ncbi:dnaJ subfamily A member 2 [Histomonas meleagridis]|uniref:dnaJ-like subfamily A member 2 n=1 Tax=Histomonas meleagridis TaxID=135588 RepID=UPI003559B723|nr:dnaJ subfamily A member 2 [Histomonas meleagridis]KAH0806913.1 dnaJ-like subfamily A member 2 [Histomonas meleagridis]
MVVETELYDILGVKPDVNEHDLKRAFIKRAREVHPDKNPNDPNATEKFQKVNEAYEILKDPTKREIYDKYGSKGLEENQNAPQADDIFSAFFGPHANHKPRTNNITQEIDVTLEELYTGCEKNVSYTRYVACNACKATGTKDGKPAPTCPKCDGHGEVIVTHQTPQGLIQSIQTCPECNGMGESITDEIRCPTCHGKKLIEETKDIIVHVKPGMEDGEKIVFQGASSEIPGAETGDVIIILNEIAHDVFTRNHNDLLIRKRLTLSEAIYGARFVIEHLDGRKLVVETDAKAVIQPGDVQRIVREGMPVRGDPFNRGTLYIMFNVLLPQQSELSMEFRHSLCKVVPHRDEAKGINTKDENVFVVKPEMANIEDFENAKRTKSETRREAYDADGYDDDDEDDEEGQQVGCQPM